MALDLFMIGLMVQDMTEALTFYRRLGLAVPDGSENETHVQIKMGTGLTFFLDSNPARWDPSYDVPVRRGSSPDRSQDGTAAAGRYPMVLEFYLERQSAVQAKYEELTSFGYYGHRAPYATSFGMCFALVEDPDGNTILLSGDLEA
jgi:catechol 2,3-dioxygenase-like lactoylglutathione lyase family enzyme